MSQSKHRLIKSDTESISNIPKYNWNNKSLKMNSHKYNLLKPILYKSLNNFHINTFLYL